MKKTPKIISHRGNLRGPTPATENQPSQIQSVLDLGYDVEIDVWFQEGKLYLGHDAPTHPVTRQFLQNERLWCHCKNEETFRYLDKFSTINAFQQENEDRVHLRSGKIWLHSRLSEEYRTAYGPHILVDLARGVWTQEDLDKSHIYGLCTDWAGDFSPSYRPPFDLLIADIDGVMTTGQKIYSRDGKVWAKEYCDLDFTALKRFQAAGVKVCFFSGDLKVNKEMAESRKIELFHNPPGLDKADMLEEIKKHFSATTVAYVGDDFMDLSIMDCVDHCFCPSTAILDIRHRCGNNVLDCPGGHGVLAKLYEKVSSQLAAAYPTDSPDINPT